MGLALSPGGLVEHVENMQRKSPNPIDNENVWFVFDKDDFPSFAPAIEKAKQKKYNCAWSNECFEIWYLLHFNYYNSAISRQDYIVKLNKIFKEKFNIEYKKNDENMFEILSRDSSLLKNAIRNTYVLKKIHDVVDMTKQDYSKKCDMANPCTNVDELVIFLYNLIDIDLSINRK